MRALLTDHWWDSVMSRRFSLVICVVFALLAYGLLLIPSIDVFFGVLRATFSSHTQPGVELLFGAICYS